ncbi:MAG: OsmC family protein [Lysobacterales bacterium]
MAIKKHGSAQWQGGLKDGRGTISTESGALDEHPYGFAQRFEGVKGSNPEELIGAAHAACFSMALSQILGEAGFTADYIKTSAEVTLDKKGDDFAVTGSRLTLQAKIPGIEESQFKQAADEAKQGCPISKLLATEISLQAVLQ